MIIQPYSHNMHNITIVKFNIIRSLRLINVITFLLLLILLYINYSIFVSLTQNNTLFFALLALCLSFIKSTFQRSFFLPYEYTYHFLFIKLSNSWVICNINYLSFLFCIIQSNRCSKFCIKTQRQYI